MNLELSLDQAFLKLTNQVKTYKLKHVPTGLFFRPNGGFRGIMEKKPNVSKRGKEYRKAPVLPKTYVNHERLRVYTIPEEWVVIEILKEKP